MSNHAITDAENTFIKAEPIIAAHAGAAIVGYTGTLLVTHGVITHDQASALTQQVLPAVVAGLLLLLGIIVRRFVAPAALFAQRVEEEVQKRLEGTAASPTVTPVPGFALYRPDGSLVASGTAGTSGTAGVVSPPAGAEPIEVAAEDFLPADAGLPAAADAVPAQT